MDMFIFVQLKHFKTSASTSCISVTCFQGHLLCPKQKPRKKVFKSHLKENIQMEKGAVSKEPQM